jgi:hypothetical protein
MVSQPHAFRKFKFQPGISRFVVGGLPYFEAVLTTDVTTGVLIAELAVTCDCQWQCHPKNHNTLTL